jgi:hypothetical protein
VLQIAARDYDPILAQVLAMDADRQLHASQGPIEPLMLLGGDGGRSHPPAVQVIFYIEVAVISEAIATMIS